MMLCGKGRTRGASNNNNDDDEEMCNSLMNRLVIITALLNMSV